MTGLILKSSYIRPGCGAEGYLRYIATRDGVELVTGNGPPSPKQRELIQKLLRDFPDSEQLPEHEVYQQHATVSTASSFIAAAIDDNAHLFRKGEQYLRYVAQRPRSHGLFSSERSVDLDASMETVAHHEGPVWIFICSLRQEDAARLGYDRADSWRSLVLAHQTELAQAMKISPSSFRWRAAFHDEKHHPHIHMMVWSADPKQGYLTEKGIEKMRSQLSNEIFRDELLSLYQKKDLSYSQVRDAATEAMGRLIREMETGLCHSSIIMEQMETLAGMLECHKGKKVYGYLPPEVKLMVDGIVDALAADERVAKAYDLWNEMRETICRTYSENLPERLPLSKQKEFKPVRNMVIREALQLARQQEGIGEEQEQPIDPIHLQQEAETGDAAAMGTLGKRLLGQRRITEGLFWLEQSAGQGDPSAQYALGKWHLKRGNVSQALRWLGAAADQNHSAAQYRLGMLYLQGELVEKDVNQTLRHLTASCENGNQYAQYALGRLYLLGGEVPQDQETARAWLSRSAAQGNVYAQALLDHPDRSWTAVAQSVTQLLYHMSRIFEDNCKTDAMHRGLQIDRKRRRQLRERRLAMGHKPDDHENEEIRLR